jgi:hypothetical protein
VGVTTPLKSFSCQNKNGVGRLNHKPQAFFPERTKTIKLEL